MGKKKQCHFLGSVICIASLKRLQPEVRHDPNKNSKNLCLEMRRRVRKGKQDLQIYLLIIGKIGYGELGPESQKTAIEWGNGWELRILIQAHHYEQRESKFVKWKLWVTKNCSLCRAKTCWSFFINMWYAG